MTRKNLNDTDTDLGLPRRLGWKVAGWSLGILQTITIVLVGFVFNSVLDLRERMVRLETAYSMRASGNINQTTPVDTVFYLEEIQRINHE